MKASCPVAGAELRETQPCALTAPEHTITFGNHKRQRDMTGYTQNLSPPINNGKNNKFGRKQTILVGNVLSANSIEKCYRSTLRHSLSEHSEQKFIPLHHFTRCKRNIPKQHLNQHSKVINWDCRPLSEGTTEALASTVCRIGYRKSP